ncbi:MAG: hypothetical protein IK078_00590 [Lachnospiraceae bacterium]|nr:hypothetical protein [Lachnospiraceae bacterium]
MRTRIRIQSMLIAVLALVAVITMSQPAAADYTQDQENGVSYDDTMYCTVGRCQKYAYGGDDTSYIYMTNDGDSIQNVKASSPNLIAKVVSRYYRKYKECVSDDTYDEQGNYVPAKYEIRTDYGSTYIACYAKKKGSYKVTFDVVKADGTLRCTKTIKVYTTYPVTKSPIKKVTYAGKDIYSYYPYTKVTSGKLSVTMNKGYKLKKIEILTPGKDGKTVTKAVKNNKTIKLAKTEKYTADNYSSKSEYNSLFPCTDIRITYTDKKTGEEASYYYYLYTLNRK